MKVLIGINTLTMIDSQVYGNHMAFFYHLGRLKESKNIEVLLYTPWRLSIDRMRNMAAAYALQTDCDYLMFIDDDMLVSPNTLESLVDADKDIVMAHTYIRGYPFNPMAFITARGKFGDPDFELRYYTDLLEHKDEKGLVAVDAVGFACVLIKTSLLRQISKPYFITTPNNTEDVYFCLKCKSEYPNVTIAVDTRVPTGHLLDKEAVMEDTVKYLRDFYKNFQNSKEVDRGANYIESIRKVVESKGISI
jgi:hypothetical protein